MTFRFIDRWQTSIGDALHRAFPGAALGEALGLLEQHDRLLEAYLSRSTGRCGFHVTRTTNDAAIAAAGAADVTWNHVVERTWSTFEGFSSGAALTVPREGGGLYAVSAFVYYGGAAAGLFLSVTVNNVQVAGGHESAAGQSRASAEGLVRVVPGDILRLHIANLSAGAITPTFFAGDVNTALSPYFKAWRIAP